MEAMKTETPVIASRVGGVPEILADGDAGQLVTPSSIEDIREAIVRYRSDVEFAERYVKRALTMVCEEYGIESATNQYVSVYESL